MGQWQVMCLGRKMKCPDRDPAQSKRFWVELEFEAVVTGHGRQRKQKKRLETIGNESGQCAKLVVGLYSRF